MSDLLMNLKLGFGVALMPTNLMFGFVGVLVGTLIGVLPGLGPLATMSMLLPLTFYMAPEASLIMLAGIYYGAQYGGSTTAILVNLPGESSSAVTCIDGYQMALQGRGGSALAIAALGSFFAGTVGTLLIALLAPSLSELGLLFRPPDYFALMVLGLAGAMVLASGSLLKAFGMICLGLMLGLIGTDVNSGTQRFTFGVGTLMDGLDFVPLAVGMFGLAEIINNLSRPDEERTLVSSGEMRLWPSREDFDRAWPAVLRGTGLGSLLGILPGGGALLSSFAAYSLEKKLSRRPEEFGRGAVEGVAGPEAANNAGAQTSFIPMLTLGIPSNVVMAIMMGAMAIHGIAPGPRVMTERPALFWGMVVSMWIGNLMLVIIHLPLIGVWVRLLTVPYRIMFPAVIVLCAVGVYSITYNAADIGLAALFGLFGFILIRLGCEPAPLALGFVLGPLMEENFRRAMLISGGDASVFVRSPLSLALLLAAGALLVSLVLPAIRTKREAAFHE